MTSPTSNQAEQLIAISKKVNDIQSQRVTYVAGVVSSINIANSTFGADITQPDGTTTTVVGVGSSPHFLPAVGNVVNLGLSGSQIIYQPYGVAAGSIDTPQLSTTVTGSINTATTIASSKTTAFYAGIAPTSGMATGDLWVNTGSNNTLYRWSGSAWVQIQDQQIQSALVNAGTAQATADGKIQTYNQTSAPVSGMGTGDLWFDTDDGNKAYRFNGATWIVIQDQSIAAALAAANGAQATADTKVLVFAQPTQPTAQEVGDVWFETDNGNQMYIWGPTPTVTRVNLALNPSFEGQAPGNVVAVNSWNLYSSGTVGTMSRSIVTTGGVTNGAVAAKSSSSSQAATAGTGHGFQQSYVAAPGNLFRAQATFQVGTTGSNFVPHIQLEPLNVSGTVLAGTVTASGSGTVTTAQTLSVTTTALPATTTQVRLTVQRRTAVTTGVALTTADVTIDSVLVEKNRDAAAPTTYFDGDTPAASNDSKWDTPSAAPSSTSTYWQPGVSGVNAWQSQQLRDGAIEPQSILGNNCIAYGSITAPLLEALLVLAGTVVAGNPNADHAALMVDGLHLFRTIAGEGVQEVGTLAVSGTGTKMQWVDSTGATVAQVDQTGLANFNDLNVADDPTFQGYSLAAALTNIPGGGGAGTTAPGARNYVGWNSGAVITGITTTTEQGILEVAFTAEANRIYWLVPAFFWWATDVTTYLDMKIRDGGSGTPTTSSPQVDQEFFSNANNSGNTILAQAIRPFRFAAGVHRLLLTAQAGNVGTVNVSVPTAACTSPILSIIDMGPDYGNPAGVTRGGGGTPAPPQQFYTELSPTSWVSYTGSNVQRVDTTDVVQGFDPAGVNGDGYGWWLFSLPSITGSVDRVDFYSKTNYTALTGGGTAIVNMVPSTVAPTSGDPSPKLGTDQPVSGYPHSGTKAYTTLSTWWPQFKTSPPTGARAVGISVGNAGSTTTQDYIRFDGPTARLRIWYTQ